MNDERCDRDRVTAIEAAIAKQLERDYYPVAPAIAKSVMRTPALLEALDTIDKLEGENELLVQVASEACDGVPGALDHLGDLLVRQVLNPTEGESP